MKVVPIKKLISEHMRIKPPKKKNSKAETASVTLRVFVGEAGLQHIIVFNEFHLTKFLRTKQKDVKSDDCEHNQDRD